MNNIAQAILKNIGGVENIRNCEHCVTRLRIEVKDKFLINKTNLEQIKGVIAIIENGRDLQIVMGNKSSEVYDQFQSIKKNQKTNGFRVTKTDNKWSFFFQTLSEIFVPILPALTGSGILKAVLILVKTLGWVTPNNQTYEILLILSNTVFYFLPVILAYTAAVRFKVDPYIAVILGALLINPDFVHMTNLAIKSHTTIKLFNLPVTPANYSSSVVPIILTVYLLSFIQPFIYKIAPSTFRNIFSPAITLLVMTPITLIVIGPIGSWLGNGLANGINVINLYCGWLIPAIIGASTPLLVMTGMHYAMISVAVNSLAKVGYETFAGPGMIVSNIAQGGAAFAVSILSKDKKVKSLGVSTGLTALFGITEPALYGINLRFGRPLIAAMIGGGLGGLYEGIMNVKRYAQVPPSILALPSFIDKNGDVTSCYNVAIALIISFCTAFIIELFWGLGQKKGQRN